MKDKLEVGMYVRYIPTIGEYTQKISKITKTKNCLLDMCYTLDEEEEVFSSHFDDILGASHNIIDLIQVGDIITTNNLCGEVTRIEGDKIYTTCYDGEYCYDYQIQSIVTKEQFENMKYEVK